MALCHGHGHSKAAQYPGLHPATNLKPDRPGCSAAARLRPIRRLRLAVTAWPGVASVSLVRRDPWGRAAAPAQKRGRIQKFERSLLTIFRYFWYAASLHFGACIPIILQASGL